jgi:hypothetical protein
MLVLVSVKLSAAPTDEKFHLQGVYLFNVITTSSTTDVDFDESNGLAAYFGYQILPWFSVEVGGLKFDPVNGFENSGLVNLQTEFEATGYTAGIKAVGSFYELFDYWVGIGQYSWDSTFNYQLTYASFPGLNRTGSDTNSGRDMYYRIGVSAPVTQNFSLTLEVSEFELNDFFSEVDGFGENTDFKQRIIGFGVETRF